ncbi:MAG: metallophosphoesterase [Bacteroidales bacterium]|nr:metallophosphoesterase [Bacteroidales bacterium]
MVLGIISFFISGFKADRVDIIITIYIAIILPKIFFTIISSFDIPLRRLFKWKIYPFTLIALLTAIITEAIIIYGSIWGKTNLHVNNIELFSPKIPTAFDDYKIVQISDLHLGNLKNGKPFIEKLVNITNAQDPDIVVVTGDLVNHYASELIGYENILSGIKAKDGIYSVLGNHDYGLYNNWENEKEKKKNFEDLILGQKNMGWTLLNNENIILQRDNESIAIIGVENSGNHPFPEYGDLLKAMKGTENTDFKILLSHDPSHWRREVLDSDIDLMLAGHTHGAQFSIGNFSLASYAYPEWKGLYTEKNKSLYVNPGIGSVGIPFRFGSWPEITVIILKKDK